MTWENRCAFERPGKRLRERPKPGPLSVETELRRELIPHRALSLERLSGRLPPPGQPLPPQCGLEEWCEWLAGWLPQAR